MKLHDALDTLGLNETDDLTEKDVRKAFKLRAQKCHPDREGGDAHAFNQIKQAEQAVLQYLLTGYTEEANSYHLHMSELIMSLMVRDPEGDWSRAILKSFNVRHTQLAQEIEGWREEGQRIKAGIKRIKRAPSSAYKVWKDHRDLLARQIKAKRAEQLEMEAITAIFEADFEVNYKPKKPSPHRGNYVSQFTISPNDWA